MPCPSHAALRQLRDSSLPATRERRGRAEIFSGKITCPARGPRAAEQGPSPLPGRVASAPRETAGTGPGEPQGQGLAAPQLVPSLRQHGAGDRNGSTHRCCSPRGPERLCLWAGLSCVLPQPQSLAAPLLVLPLRRFVPSEVLWRRSRDPRSCGRGQSCGGQGGEVGEQPPVTECPEGAGGARGSCQGAWPREGAGGRTKGAAGRDGAGHEGCRQRQGTGTPLREAGAG